MFCNTSPLKVIAQGLSRPSCKLSLAPGFSLHRFRPFYQSLSPWLCATGSPRMHWGRKEAKKNIFLNYYEKES